MTQEELTELRQMARESSRLIPMMSKPQLRELLAVYDAAFAAVMTASDPLLNLAKVVETASRERT